MFSEKNYGYIFGRYDVWSGELDFVIKTLAISCWQLADSIPEKSIVILKRVIHSEPGASSDTINPRPMRAVILIQNILKACIQFNRFNLVTGIEINHFPARSAACRYPVVAYITRGKPVLFGGKHKFC